MQVDKVKFHFSDWLVIKVLLARRQCLFKKHQLYFALFQIDIVPTLSLLLGTPIPFSNLGAVIPDFIPGEKIASCSTFMFQFCIVFFASASATSTTDLDSLDEIVVKLPCFF